MINTSSPRFGAVTVTCLNDANESNVDKPQASADERRLKVTLALTDEDQAAFGSNIATFSESVESGPDAATTFKAFDPQTGRAREIQDILEDQPGAGGQVAVLKHLVDLIRKIPPAETFTGTCNSGKTSNFSLSGVEITTKLLKSLKAVAAENCFKFVLANALKGE